MNDSKLVSILKYLRQKEWTLFLQFLSSPYHHKHPKVLELATHLADFVGRWDSGDLNRKKVFTRLHPGTPFKWQRLKDLSSQLLKQYRQFLIQEQLRQLPDLSRALLVQACQKQELSQLKQQQLVYFEQQKSPGPTNDFLHFRLLEHEKEEVLKHGRRAEAQPILDEQISLLEDVYWRERLRLEVERLSIKRVLRSEIAPEHQLVEEHIPETVVKSSRIVNIYLSIYRMLTRAREEREVYFQLLRQYLQANHFPDCDDQETYSFYLYAINFCAARINAGEPGYYPHLFSIYELLVEHQRLIQNETLSQWSYTNIVATACHLQQYRWAESFIHDYHSYIPPDQRQNALHYNSALLYFYEQRYDLAQQHLQQIRFTDPYYSLNARVLELRVIYKQEEWLFLEDLLERFRIFLLRDRRLPQYRKKEAQNFYLTLRKLANIFDQELDRKRRMARQQEVYQQLEGDIPMMHRSWLRTQIQP